MNTTIQPKIGEGIFVIKDVANILDISSNKARYWLIEFWNNDFGSGFGGYSFGDNKNRAINFYTLIEFIVFAKLREKGISAQRIKRFHKDLARELKSIYPFAKTKLLTDRRNLWYEHAEEIIKLDGKKQISFKKILAPFLHKIEFGNEGALRYFPLGKKSSIVIDPHHQFGQPVISGTNIKAEVIYALYEGKEPKQNICSLYNISQKEVNDAIAYCKKIAA